MWLRALRLAIVRSNVGPLSTIYRWCYRGIAWGLVGALRVCFPGAFESISLRGSLAMGLLVPAVSDIDLFIVLRDPVDPEEHERINRFYRWAARWLPILDPHPWILRWCDVGKLYEENPSVRFRVLEGKEAFETVFGTERFAELPESAPADIALAQLVDLKSRLTYFNAFCLTDTYTDELEARRKEYMLFKLTVEIARVAIFLHDGELLFRRLEIIRRFTTPDAVEMFRDLRDDAVLREFVTHTARYRLRRPFCRASGISLDALEERLLRVFVGLFPVVYSRAEIRDREDVATEYGHFYGDERFLPTGHEVRRISTANLNDYGSLKREILEWSTRGVDTVLETEGLLLNLSNADPQLGNCTVVARPVT